MEGEGGFGNNLVIFLCNCLPRDLVMAAENIWSHCAESRVHAYFPLNCRVHSPENEHHIEVVLIYCFEMHERSLI